MSNFQEQSLDENAVILPVSESSPEFLHCEKERRAVESLLGAGPEAFYSAVGAERCSCFLSPQEVRHITGWAQEDQRLRVQHLENGDGGSSERDDLHSTYFPCRSDTPAPDLDLGWPERSPWVQHDSITVHSSRPAEGGPSIRQIIRGHLQMAGKVIAIVTDSLTDGPIIGDLHSAASRGVAVYIILNHRSTQEAVTLTRLQHPNIRLRVLGGRTFRSRTGTTVVGEMKAKFLLVDLETVIHGSYSLTWTDAHLHQQLVTVLRGPVVDSFDREFRILFASSLPLSHIQWAADAPMESTDQPEDVSDLRLEEQLSLEPRISSPPSPPADSFLDWEAMGVVKFFPDDAEPLPQLDDLPITDGSAENGNQYVDVKRDLNDFYSNPADSPTDPASLETMKRVDKKLHKALSRRLRIETSTISDHATATGVDDGAAEHTQTLDRFSSSKRSESDGDSIVVEESNVEQTTCRVGTTASRKPLILRVPDSFSSHSDIMRTFRVRTSGLFRKTPKCGAAEMSQSVMDLSSLNTEMNHDERRSPLSSLKATGLNSDPVTPASTLMQKRNNEKKMVMQRAPKTFLLSARPHLFGFSLGMNSRTRKEGDSENT